VILDKFAWAALSSRETLQATYDLAMLAINNNVPGDFVECGVFAGAQCAAMATAIQVLRPIAYADMLDVNRRVHLFDSFRGIPPAGARDIGWTHPPGTSICELDQVKQYMADWGIDESLLVYHPGDFAETLPRARGYIRDDQALLSNKIAILRIDCDLYESTKLVLENLYPLVVPGGWVIFDDYALPGCRDAVEEYFGGNLGPCYFQRQP
jgi:O-methyltransferase